MRRWGCLRWAQEGKIKDTAEKESSMNLPFTKQVLYDIDYLSQRSSIYRMLCAAQEMTLMGI